MSLAFRLLYWGSMFCVLLSAVMHAATFFGQAFLPAIFMVPMLFILWPLVVWQWRQVPRGNLVSEIFGAIPRWMKAMTAGLFLYFFFNLFWCSAATDGGVPIRRSDGSMVLQRKEQIMRVLNEAQFHEAQALQTRMISGHLLTFYGLAVVALQAFWIKTGPAMANARLKPRRVVGSA